MTEILTESFCERCGTRYTFESAAPRRSRIGRVRTLSKGMKNFVLSDDASFSEAMAEARSEEELAVVSHQLDAFHQTFNFCLTCRQYTCGDCWNVAEGRCLTCAPIPGMPEPVLASAPFVETLPGPGEAYADPEPDQSWPDEDLSAARLSRALGFDEAETEATLEAVSLDDDAFDLAAAEAAAAAVAAPANPVESTPWVDDALPERAEADAEAVPPADAVGDEDDAPEIAGAAAVAGVAPGQSLEDAVAEYEARIAAEEAEQADMARAAAAAIAAAAAVEPPIARIDIEDEATIELPEPVAEERVAVAAESPIEPAVAGEEVAVAAEVEPAAAEAEPETLTAATSAEPEPAVAADPEPEPVAPAPEEVPAATDVASPLAAAAVVEPEPEPEPERAAPGLDAAAVLGAATDAPDVPAAPRVDVVPQPTWPQPTPAQTPDVTAPPTESPAPQANPWLTVAPDEADAPQWPAAPAFPVSAGRREMPTTLAGRPLLPQVDPADMWAASAREVLTGTPQAPIPAATAAPTAQPCVSCGLSLSANARFCRRCGTRQG